MLISIVKRQNYRASKLGPNLKSASTRPFRNYALRVRTDHQKNVDCNREKCGPNPEFTQFHRIGLFAAAYGVGYVAHHFIGFISLI